MEEAHGCVKWIGKEVFFSERDLGLEYRLVLWGWLEQI